MGVGYTKFPRWLPICRAAASEASSLRGLRLWGLGLELQVFSLGGGAGYVNPKPKRFRSIVFSALTNLLRRGPQRQVQLEVSYTRD